MSSPTAQDVPNLVSLPDAALLNIFSRLPLDQVLTLGQVSPQWRCLQAMALRRVRSLTVMSGPFPMNMVEQSEFRYQYSNYVVLPEGSDRELLSLRRVNKNRMLQFDALSRDKLDLLIGSFTGLVDVQIVMRGAEVSTAIYFDQLITLLTGWRHRLESLTLLAQFLHDDPSASNRLIASINALTHLKNLFIEMSYIFGEAILDLSILGRLERFQFYSWDDPKDVLNALRRYAQSNPQLRQVALGIGCRNFSDFVNLDAHLSSRVTIMFVKNPEEDFEEIDVPTLPKLIRTCNQFSALTYLESDIVDCTALELTTVLQSLKQLFYLKLHLIAFGNQICGNAEHRPDHSAGAPGPRLDSIQVLVLEQDSSNSHQDIAEAFNYPWTFPSVRLVRVTDVHGFNRCVTCAIPLTDHIYRYRPPRCMALCMAAFKHCPKLIKAVYCYYRQYYVEYSPTDLNFIQ